MKNDIEMYKIDERSKEKKYRLIDQACKSQAAILKRTLKRNKSLHTHTMVFHRATQEDNMACIIFSLYKSILFIIPLLIYRPVSLENMLFQIKPLWSKWMDTGQFKWPTYIIKANLGFAEFTFYWTCPLPILTYFEICTKETIRH